MSGAPESPGIAIRSPTHYVWLAMRNAVAAGDREAVLGVLWLAGQANITLQRDLIEMTYDWCDLPVPGNVDKPDMPPVGDLTPLFASGSDASARGSTDARGNLEAGFTKNAAAAVGNTEAGTQLVRGEAQDEIPHVLTGVPATWVLEGNLAGVFGCHVMAL